MEFAGALIAQSMGLSPEVGLRIVGGEGQFTFKHGAATRLQAELSKLYGPQQVEVGVEVQTGLKNLIVKPADQPAMIFLERGAPIPEGADPAQLLTIPMELRGLKGAEAAKHMGLPDPPSKYYRWVKTKGNRLTVAKRPLKEIAEPPKQELKQLRYDPVNREFVEVEPSTKADLVALLKNIPADLQGPAQKAMEARDAMGDMGKKTGARAPDGTTKTSGWGKVLSSLDLVFKLCKRIGHTLATQDGTDHLVQIASAGLTTP